MTRKLPWKRKGPETTPASAAGSPRTNLTPGAVRRLQAQDNALNTSPAAPYLLAGTPKRLKRPGSSSPPPEPLEESLMIDGIDQDDMYRMVEDEFLATAKQFTVHLHTAEYQRLKAAARSTKAETIRNISRPVVGAMSETVRKKQERTSLQSRQSRALKRARPGNGVIAADSDESDDNAKTLFGMMESPRKQPMRLYGIVPAKATVQGVASPADPQSPSRPRKLSQRPAPDNRLLQSPKSRDSNKTGQPSHSGHVDVQETPGGSGLSRQGPPTPVRPRSSSEESDGDFFSRMKRKKLSYKSREDLRKEAKEG